MEKARKRWSEMIKTSPLHRRPSLCARRRLALANAHKPNKEEMSVTRTIDGNQIAKEVKEELRAKVERLKQEHGVTPCLSVVLVGDRGDSATYVRMKQRAAELLGMSFRLVARPADVSQEELLQVVDDLNNDPAVHGLIVQLPLPAHINEAAGRFSSSSSSSSSSLQVPFEISFDTLTSLSLRQHNDNHRNSRDACRL